MIGKHLAFVDARLGGVDKRLDSIETRIDKRFDTLTTLILNQQPPQKRTEGFTLASGQGRE